MNEAYSLGAHTPKDARAHTPGKYHDDGDGLGETYRYYSTETFPYIVRIHQGILLF